MDYFEFKARYIETLKKFLNCKPSDNYNGLICGEESSALSETLADMEELHPIWVERIEDVLAEQTCWDTDHFLET